MIRDDSDEKPNSDGSTLPPFLAPPFFFPAAWKPSSSCCFAPFLPPALFVQEGMGWGKREGSDVWSGKRELQAAWVCKQGRRVMARCSGYEYKYGHHCVLCQHPLVILCCSS